MIYKHLKNPTNVILGTSDHGTAHLPVLGILMWLIPPVSRYL